MKNSSSDWQGLPPHLRPTKLPLWLRTQKRLQKMEWWSQQLLSSEDGCDPVIQAMEQEVMAKSVHLLARLREWEENHASSRTPLDRGL